jgi:hypothetical protein
VALDPLFLAVMFSSHPFLAVIQEERLPRRRISLRWKPDRQAYVEACLATAEHGEISGNFFTPAPELYLRAGLSSGAARRANSIIDSPPARREVSGSRPKIFARYPQENFK